MSTAIPLETSYLEHLHLAVGAKDYSAPFRTFFDNWFAFHVGGPFLNRNSRPHWFNHPCPDRHASALRRAHYVSPRAARTLAQLTRERLVKDHCVPVAVLRDLLFAEEPAGCEQMRQFLMRYYRIGILTEGEHRVLSEVGLGSRMPEGWSADGSVFARYEAAGIATQEMAAPPPAVEQAEELQKASNPLSRFLNSAAMRPRFDLGSGREAGS